MKKLYLMRHATSNWPEHISTDFERPLTKEGEDEAWLMADRFKAKNITIDLMLVSSAIRTQATSKFLCDVVDIKQSIVTKEIYETTHNYLLEMIQKTPDEIESLLLVSHNPSISMLTTILLGTYVDLPPAVVVEIFFDVKSWKDIGRESITHDSIEVPSMF